MPERRFKVGDPVVYLKTKHSACPGPRASHIIPQEHGEDYTYQVEKFWRVREVYADGRILVYTRTGKQHVYNVSDRNLHKAGFLKYLLWRRKFPALDPPDLDDADNRGAASV